jgi:hypothetical protein
MVSYLVDFTGLLAVSAVAKCSRAAFKTLGWNTPSANSSLVIFAGCFLNFGFFIVTL